MSLLASDSPPVSSPASSLDGTMFGSVFVQFLVRKRGVTASLAPTLLRLAACCSSRVRAGLSVRVMKRGNEIGKPQISPPLGPAIKVQRGGQKERFLFQGEGPSADLTRPIAGPARGFSPDKYFLGVEVLYNPNPREALVSRVHWPSPAIRRRTAHGRLNPNHQWQGHRKREQRRVW